MAKKSSSRLNKPKRNGEPRKDGNLRLSGQEKMNYQEPRINGIECLWSSDCRYRSIGWIFTGRPRAKFLLQRGMLNAGSSARATGGIKDEWRRWNQRLAGIRRKALIHLGDCSLICSMQLAVRVARMSDVQLCVFGVGDFLSHIASILLFWAFNGQSQNLLSTGCIG